MSPEDYLAELKSALNEYRYQDVATLNEAIVPAEFQDRQIKSALGLIRRKRLFRELERASGLFVMAGRGSPLVRRQYAQALLDQNRVPQALGTLVAMLPEVAGDPQEGSEVQGLIGRAYKQWYVNEGQPEHLAKAIEAYTPYWHTRQGDYKWHGVNLVALLLRARRDGIDPRSGDDPRTIARAIREDIEDTATGYVWDYGTAVECSVALGEDATALEWAAKYVKHPDADAFEFGSTLRQLKEVWQLEGTPLGNKLLPVLEYALLNRKDGTLEPMTVGKVKDPGGFEAVWGADSYIYIDWMDTMYQRCLGVARVFDRNTGTRWGTGFLVPGKWFRPDWGEAPVFVTNAHVASTNPADAAPLKPEDAVAEFTRLPERPKVDLGELLFSSPRVDLDASILRVQPPAGATSFAPTEYLPVLPQPGEQAQRIYVIGHPNGGELAISLYDNDLVQYDGPYIHYRSPTEGGHSGSPVFTRQWKLIALHHRAREELQVNEGVCMEPIQAAAQAAA